MKITRREFIRQSAAAAAAAVAGIPLPGSAANIVTDSEFTRMKWSKAPCRFCGTGCGVNVAVKDGRVVATHGDIKAEVNRGLNCVKGYFLSKIMYGADRLTTPLLRMKDGKYDKNGEFAPVSWDRAFDEMAAQFKRVLKEKGPTAVGMFGSGQWTVWEGYAASKLMKAGFRSNNIDPNARHCMASAVQGFMRTFGMDEPMGCYDDIEQADAFVLWGSNMAEMHPILWTRVTDRRLSPRRRRKVAVLSVFEHRSFELADIPIIFTPQTDLAILNYIANYIIRNNKVNRDFVNKHTTFKLGNDDIGYGLRPEHPLQKKAKNAGDAGGGKPISFDEYAKFVARYDAGDGDASSRAFRRRRLDQLAELYADPKIKVMSFWTMGFNQHTRGVWCNNLVYNLHLLTGKIATPGNSPFSLTGQPSACGTAREVGTFSHRLPADMVVTNPKHRETAEKIWKLPAGTIPDKPGFHAVLQNRMLKDGKLNAYWVHGQQQHAGGGQSDAGRPSRLSQSGQLHRRVGRLSDGDDARRGSGAAGRDVGGEGRRLRQRGAAHAVLAPARRRARRGALRPVAARGILQALQGGGGVAEGAARQEARVSRQDALRRPLPERQRGQVPVVADRSGVRERRGEGLRLLPAEGTVRGVRGVRPRPRARSRRRSMPITRRAACAGRWSTARRRSGAIARAPIHTSRRAPASSSTAIPTARR